MKIYGFLSPAGGGYEFNFFFGSYKFYELYHPRLTSAVETVGGGLFAVLVEFGIIP